MAMGYKQVIAHRLGRPPEYNYSASASYYILATVLITGLYLIPIHIPYTYTWISLKMTTYSIQYNIHTDTKELIGTHPLQGIEEVSHHTTPITRMGPRHCTCTLQGICIQEGAVWGQLLVVACSSSTSVPSMFVHLLSQPGKTENTYQYCMTKAWSQ